MTTFENIMLMLFCMVIGLTWLTYTFICIRNGYIKFPSVFAKSKIYFNKHKLFAITLSTVQIIIGLAILILSMVSIFEMI
jgi:hypothetical protein